MELNALLAHPVALPSLPRAVALLMTELAHDEPSLRRVAQLIGTDPALAARLLELANTPAFQMQRQIAAYTAGLLHAVGELVIHLADPDKAQAVNTLVAPFDLRRDKIEQRIFGYSYGHVTAGCARRWQLPEVVIDALQYQAAPFDNNVYEPLAGVIHLAAWGARAREAELSDKELAVSFPGEVGLALGLDIDMVLQQDPIDWTAKPEAADYVV